MPLIVATSMQGTGQRALTETTCTASDTITYEAGDILIFRNPTGGSLSPIIDGAAGSTWPVDGLGDVNISAGYAVGAIAAGQARVIPLDTIRAYLQGVITITGATGLVASMLRKN